MLNGFVDLLPLHVDETQVGQALRTPDSPIVLQYYSIYCTMVCTAIKKWSSTSDTWA